MPAAPFSNVACCHRTRRRASRMASCSCFSSSSSRCRRGEAVWARVHVERISAAVLLQHFTVRVSKRTSCTRALQTRWQPRGKATHTLSGPWVSRAAAASDATPPSVTTPNTSTVPAPSHIMMDLVKISNTKCSACSADSNRKLRKAYAEVQLLQQYLLVQRKPPSAIQLCCCVCQPGPDGLAKVSLAKTATPPLGCPKHQFSAS